MICLLLMEMTSRGITGDGWNELWNIINVLI